MKAFIKAEENENMETAELQSPEERGYHDKSSLLIGINEVIDSIKAGEGDEAHKSLKSHNAYVEFAEMFLSRVEHSFLPEGMDPHWQYSVDINEKGASLWLEYVEIDEEARRIEKGYVCTIREAFQLIDMDPELLTVEEYANLHEVNVVTVRQWIRRGKIRDAQKIAKEWRIPKFVEPAIGKYKSGIFYWREKISDFPSEFDYITDYDEAAIAQMDKDTYKVIFSTFTGAGRKCKVVFMPGKDREKLELFFISNPLITCCDGGVDFDKYTEEGEFEETFMINPKDKEDNE